MLEIAVALYPASAFPKVEVDACEVMKGEESISTRDVIISWLPDEIVVAGEMTLVGWEEIRVDVRKLLE